MKNQSFESEEIIKNELRNATTEIIYLNSKITQSKFILMTDKFNKLITLKIFNDSSNINKFKDLKIFYEDTLTLVSFINK